MAELTNKLTPVQIQIQTLDHGALSGGEQWPKAHGELKGKADLRLLDTFN